MIGTQDLAIPIKPNIDMSRRTGRKVELHTNLLNLRFKPNSDFVYIYSLKIFPALNSDSPHLKQLFKNARLVFKSQYTNYIISGMTLLSTFKHEQVYEFGIDIQVRRDSRSNSSSGGGALSDSDSVEMDTVNYKISVTPTKQMVDTSDMKSENMGHIKSLVERVIKSVVKANDNLLRFRNQCYFDRTNPITIDLRDYGKLFIINVFRKGMLIPWILNCCTVD